LDFSAGDYIDMEKELNYLKNHSSFPERLKKGFIEFLEKQLLT